MVFELGKLLHEIFLGLDDWVAVLMSHFAVIVIWDA